MKKTNGPLGRFRRGDAGSERGSRPRIRGRSIVAKLITAFVLVVLPLYMFSTAITYYSSGRMQEEVERANESKLRFYHSHLKFELTRMTDLVTEYTIDETLSTFSTRIPIMTPYERAYNLNMIYTKLRQVKETSPYIDDVFYYVPASGQKVSAVSGIRDVDEREWRSLLASMGNLQGALSGADGGLYLLRSNPFSLDPAEAPNFLLGIRLSEAEFRRQLSDFAVADGGDVTLAFGARGDYAISSSERTDMPKFDVPPQESGQESEISRHRAGDFFYYILDDYQNHFRLTVSLPDSALLKPIRAYSTWLWLLTGLSLIVVMLFSLWTYRSVHRPMNRLVRAFKRTERGEIDGRIEHARGDEFGYLYSQFNVMLERLRSLIDENYVQRIRTGEAELKHLQSQIAPHFLYNSLFSIKQMAEVENTELIGEFSDYLGRYFRYMTRSGARVVPLGEEMDHALVYLSIQQIRFGGRIRTEIGEMEPEHRKIEVPRVLIQPIIENAFKYSLEHRGEGGLLRVSCLREGDELRIRVEDDGPELADGKLLEMQQRLERFDPDREESTGLLNVHQRLAIRFGPGFGLRLSRSELGGLAADLILPITEQKEETDETNVDRG